MYGTMNGTVKWLFSRIRNLEKELGEAPYNLDDPSIDDLRTYMHYLEDALAPYRPQPHSDY